MRDRLQEVARRVEAEALFGSTSTTAGTPPASSTLTVEDLERTMRDIDPDGRRLQEARLLEVCSRLTKDQVEWAIVMLGRVAAHAPRPTLHIVRPADTETPRHGE
jgi:hypothetical protein